MQSGVRVILEKDLEQSEKSTKHSHRSVAHGLHHQNTGLVVLKSVQDQISPSSYEFQQQHDRHTNPSMCQQSSRPSPR